MKMLRIFLVPDGKRWVDMQVPDEASIMQIWPSLAIEGVLADHQTAVPKDSVHHLMLSNPADPVRPGFTTIPGGKGA